MNEGRIFQDRTFVFDACNGQQLQHCIACINPENNNVVVVYVQTATGFWFQFFLDAGIGFLECYGAPEEDGEYRFVDFMERFNLHGAIIKQLVCQPDGKNSRIVLQFNSPEQLVLRTTKPDEILSGSELLLMPLDKNNA
jgi:hypothetical protein